MSGVSADEDGGVRVWIVDEIRIKAPRSVRGNFLPMSYGDQHTRRRYPEALPQRHLAHERNEQPTNTQRYYEAYKERRRMFRIMRDSGRSGNEQPNGKMPGSDPDVGSTSEFASQPTFDLFDLSDPDQQRNEAKMKTDAAMRESVSSENNPSRGRSDLDDRRTKSPRNLSGDPEGRPRSASGGDYGTRKSRAENSQARITAARDSAQDSIQNDDGKRSVFGDVMWDEDDENTFLMADMFKEEEKETKEWNYNGEFIKPKNRQKVRYSVEIKPTEIRGQYEADDLELC